MSARRAVLDKLTTSLVPALMVAAGACSTSGPASPVPTAGGATPRGDASAIVRLSGREVELSGGNCTWSEVDGQLVVDVGPSAAGDRLRLVAPLSWIGQDLPPGAGSSEAALSVRLGGLEVTVPAAALSGELASDLGTGRFDAGLVAGGSPLTGEFACPEVIELD